MGTWGTGLYASDHAADLKATVEQHLRLPLEPEAILAMLAAAQGLALGDEPAEADDAAFWLVLADQFHRHGIDHPALMVRAGGIIESGADLRLNEAHGMSPADLRRRAAALEKLRAKWAVPARRPVRRKLLTPEPLLMRAGEVWSYLTVEHNRPRAVLETPATSRAEAAPDGRRAFAVLAAGHAFHGMFARYLLAPLEIYRPHGEPPPDLDASLAAPFLCQAHLLQRWFRPLAGWAARDAEAQALLGAERLGRVPLDTARLAALFPQIGEAPPEAPQFQLDPLDCNPGIGSATARGYVWADVEARHIPSLGEFALGA
ncbi:hypothetical protein LNKW23_24200 [Paralimibaculum aggregatum]|uniref:DUF4259 domain-containing protein n=1 Tax=Paralimibaculum aggregatum TaxID=3036245 RepID=A0ABQ6LIU3_9RHOB|nr:hypothetical protein [Limibaculum sp. NKW23]GMG83207.1 hypothetical protein LNKW23_24200 [Limibaculum sp. NKW23]